MCGTTSFRCSGHSAIGRTHDDCDHLRRRVDKILRAHPGPGRPRSRGPARRGARLPRPERGREVDHHQRADGAAPARRRRRPAARRRSPRRRGRPAPADRVRAGGCRPLADPDRRRDHRPARAHARRAEPGSPRRAGTALRSRHRQEGQDLLHRQPPEGGSCRGLRLRRRAVHPRRADLRARPVDGDRVPGGGGAGARRGAHGAAVEPHPRRGRASGRSREHRPAGRHGGDRFARRPETSHRHPGGWPGADRRCLWDRARRRRRAVPGGGGGARRRHRASGAVRDPGVDLHSPEPRRAHAAALRRLHRCGAMNGSLTGTATLLRLGLRRDRLKLPIWTIAIALFVPGFFNSLANAMGQLGDIGDMQGIAAMLDVFAGPMYGDMFGDATLLEWFLLYNQEFVLAAAVMNILLVIRHTRGEEQRGRAMLVHGSVIGRRAPLAAALILALITNAVLAVLLTLGAVSIGFPGGSALLFGTGIAASGLVFAVVTGVTAQLAEGAGTAGGLAGLVLGVAWVMRSTFAVGPEDNVGLWLTPMAWPNLTRVLYDERWSPVALSLEIGRASGRESGEGRGGDGCVRRAREPR